MTQVNPIDKAISSGITKLFIIKNNYFKVMWIIIIYNYNKFNEIFTPTEYLIVPFLDR